MTSWPRYGLTVGKQKAGRRGRGTRSTMNPSYPPAVRFVEANIAVVMGV